MNLSRLCGVLMAGCLSACLSGCISTSSDLPSEKSSAQARAHTELAARYYEVGQVAIAVQEAEIALKSEPEYVPAHTLLALMYAQLRQNMLADGHFAKALTLAQNQKLSTTDLRNSYAWYLCQSERVEDGLAQLSQVLRDPLYGSMDKALINAAVCAARVKKWDLANSYIEAASAMHSNQGVSTLYRAHIALSTGQNKIAKEQAQQAQSLLGDTPEVQWLWARIEHAEPVVKRKADDANAAMRLSRQFPNSTEAAWLREQRWQWF